MPDRSLEDRLMILIVNLDLKLDSVTLSIKFIVL